MMSQQFEYKVLVASFEGYTAKVVADDDNKQIPTNRNVLYLYLNDLAKEGWEMISSAGYQSLVAIVLKRSASS
jgi:hypothetical protein